VSNGWAVPVVKARWARSSEGRRLPSAKWAGARGVACGVGTARRGRQLVVGAFSVEPYAGSAPASARVRDAQRRLARMSTRIV